MRTLFFGTPDIAVPSLEALHEMSEISAVVCQPDRPAGRGLELRAPPVKQRAVELGLEVVQPRKVRTGDFADWVRSQNANVAVVIAYGRILPPAVLAAPQQGCMNLHASLLPRYRGAAPINWAVVRGESESGISLMQMDEGCDTGPVFCQRTIAIGSNMTAGALYASLSTLAATVVREDLPRAVRGELQAHAQDEHLASHAPMLKKSDGEIAWGQPAQAVHDHARGMTPWPGAQTRLNKKRLKVLSTRLGSREETLGKAGTVIRIEKDYAEIACGSGSIHLLVAQVEGKKALSIEQLAAGRTLTVGTELGA